MEICVLWNYSNYFNRRVRRDLTLADYVAGRPFFNAKGENIAFNLADGIATQWTMNADPETRATFSEYGDPDYLLVIDNKDDGKRILSRWYITEVFYTRASQFTLKLRRDVVADYYDEVLDAPCIVERGPVQPDNPLVYNSEPGDVNQIKTEEHLLPDESGTPWIVGYVSRDTSAVDVTAETETVAGYPELSDLSLTLNNPADPSAGAKIEALSSSVEAKAVLYLNITDDPLGLPKRAAYIYANPSFYGYYEIDPPAFAPAAALVDDKAGLTQSTWGNQAIGDASVWFDQCRLSYDDIVDFFLSKYGWRPRDDLSAVLSADGSVYHDVDSGKYYQVGIGTIRYETTDEDLPSPSEDGNPALWYLLNNLAEQAADTLPELSKPYGGTYRIRATKATVDVTLTEVSPAGLLKLPITATRRNLTDAPYDMFCMRFTLDNMALAQSLMAQPLGEGEKKRVYDVQILPYCPRRDIFDEAALSSFEEGKDYSKILASDGNGGWDDTGDRIFWCLKSSATFRIQKRFAITQYVPDSYQTEVIKVAMKCVLHRLTAPNYSSSFEFSVAKNGGSVDEFRVDFTYRPISPYIHVAPVFSGLYGGVNDDARGLICNGDFSIDAISDAWTQYQTQNKNYQNIFDVRIKTMDSRHVWDTVGAAFGVVGSVAGGAAAGAMKGGVPGAVAGAAVGMAGGAFGLASMQAKYDLDRQAQIDVFRYELANVVAVPDTLTKVSAYNVNNKYFPIVEVYESTSQEMDAFERYVHEFNSRIGILTTIKSVLQSRYKDREYVKGQIVRLPDGSGCEPHVANEIYAEIAKGVYF